MVNRDKIRPHFIALQREMAQKINLACCDAQLNMEEAQELLLHLAGALIANNLLDNDMSLIGTNRAVHQLARLMSIVDSFSQDTPFETVAFDKK